MSYQKVFLIICFFLVAAGLAYYAAGHPMDFRVYHYGARGVFDGTRPVYGLSSGLGWPMHYRYPPLFLLLFAPMTMLPLPWSAAVWAVLKVIVLGLLLRAWSKRPKGDEGSDPSSPFPLLFIAPYLIEELRYGNAQFFVFALTAVSLWTARKRPILSAASLALGISVKVWPLFFVPYLAVRRDWKVVAYAMVFVVALTFLPSLYFGFQGNLDLLGQWYTQESQTQLGSNEIWFPNQSLRGVLMRYLTVVDYSQVPDSNYRQVDILALDPRLVRMIWMFLAGAAYVAFLAIAHRRRHSEGWLDHGLAFCLLPLLEPFTQKYALSVLLWPALAAVSLMVKPGVRILIYMATILAVVQPLIPGSAAQRLLQVLGVDFAANVLMAVALGLAISLSSKCDPSSIWPQQGLNDYVKPAGES